MTSHENQAIHPTNFYHVSQQWNFSSFDLQTRSSDQEQQYGCHDNALQPEPFPLRGFINKHAKPVVMTRTVKFTIKFYYYQYQRDFSVLQNKSTSYDKAEL